jgi:dephospho-CoA kinase
MLVIGLTGGIGSGKSTAARIFEELGVPVFDTDKIARELVNQGQPALQEIRSTFGDAVFQPDGYLNRAELKRLIFENDLARTKLEAILHPRIREQLLHDIRHSNAPYCVAVIPLLVEHHWQTLVDRVLVIDVPETMQLERARKRDMLSDNMILSIIKSQVDRKTRLAAADDIVNNEKGTDDMRQQILVLHQRYTLLAIGKQ